MGVGWGKTEETGGSTWQERKEKKLQPGCKINIFFKMYIIQNGIKRKKMKKS